MPLGVGVVVVVVVLLMETEAGGPRGGWDEEAEEAGRVDCWFGVSCSSSSLSSMPILSKRL